MSSVFLSHSHADKLFTRRLAADLRLYGHVVWIDEAEIDIGDSLIEKLRGGLDEVDFIAAILSKASVASPWVLRELDLASNRELREKRVVVLPIKLEEVPLPGFLDGKFFGDFTEDSLYQSSLQLLLRKLGRAPKLSMPQADELADLREQLSAAREAAAAHNATTQAHQTLALRGKTARLIAAIGKANKNFPSHAPINSAYAFEVVE